MKRFFEKYGKTAFTVIILLVVAVLLFSGKTDAVFGEDGLTLSATLTGSKTVAYSEIKQVSLRDGLDTGRRAFGFGGLTLTAGAFENTEFGGYSLYAYAKVKTYVVLQTADGSVIVFNRPSEADTKAAYEALLEKTGLPQ